MAEENPPASPSQPAAAQRPSDESVKETLESIIIAFILAFVFRAYVVEAFVIPTGSMAPTLLGAHVAVRCEQCGYDFTADVPQHSLKGQGENRVPVPLQQVDQAVCSMCRFPNVLDAGTVPRAGDRILVQKYLYTLTEPQRWDVVVFKYPDAPETNFIKRLVGLPNEQLLLFDGNVLTRPTDDTGQPAGPWKMARKTDRPKVQRAVWQPIYHSQYVPLDGGDGNVFRLGHEWATPWVADNPDDWQLENRRNYRYQNTAPSTLTFDFDRAGIASFSDLYAYNQFKESIPLERVEDVRLSAMLQPDASGLTARMATTARLTPPTQAGEVQTIEAQIDAQGTLRLILGNSEAGPQEITRVSVPPFQAGKTTQMEFWYVDREAVVWLDGEMVLRWPFDDTLETLKSLPAAQRLPTVTLSVEGSPVTLHQVEFDRDLYYSSRNPKHEIARGGLVRIAGRIQGEPLNLGPDDFFCLGDNSPWSHDGRYWSHIDPWVAKRLFPNQDPDQIMGIVPRELMMGRAFFVYFPAPYPLKKGAWGVLPNFGDMRFIH